MYWHCLWNCPILLTCPGWQKCLCRVVLCFSRGSKGFLDPGLVVALGPEMFNARLEGQVWAFHAQLGLWRLHRSLLPHPDLEADKITCRHFSARKGGGVQGLFHGRLGSLWGPSFVEGSQLSCPFVGAKRRPASFTYSVFFFRLGRRRTFTGR